MGRLGHAESAFCVFAVGRRSAPWSRQNATVEAPTALARTIPQHGPGQEPANGITIALSLCLESYPA